MADALPIKANFSGADPISLGEFQTGDTVPITNGGTGRTDGVVGGFKNKLINPNFEFWQRGNSFLGLTGLISQYAADRWRYDALGHTANYTQQTFTVGQSDVPGEPKYWARIAITAAGSGTGDYAYFVQNIESARTFAGKTVTLSFYAKADANKTVAIALTQYFGAGGSPSAAVHVVGTPLSLTSSWQKFTRTFSVPSLAGKTFGSDGLDIFRVRFWLSAGSDHNAATGNFNTLQTITFDLARVQIEDGPVATAFEERPQQIEFALGQRYYQVYPTVVISGVASSGGGVVYTDFTLAVAMRAAPTAALSSITYTNGSNAAINLSTSSHTRLSFQATTGLSTPCWAIPTLTLDAEL